MKFLFFSDHAHLALDPVAERPSGGSQLQVALMARELVARGHEVVLLAADTGTADGSVSQGVKIRTGGRYDTGGLKDAAAALPKVLKVLRQERPDYVVVNGWTAWLLILAGLRAVVPFRLIYICALDAEIDGEHRRKNPVRGALFELGMRLADARFSINQTQASLFHAKGMSCEISRLLFQPELVGRVPSGPKTIDLLWVARCHPVKRPRLFLDLAREMPTARCRMICPRQDVELWESIRSEAAELPNVEFIEAVPYHLIQSHFDAAKLFVNTSSHEGVPNTFIQSGLGRTAILSLAIDPDGLIEKFGAGFGAGGDWESFVHAGRRLLTVEADLEQAQEGALRFVREWHDNAANLDAFLAGLPK